METTNPTPAGGDPSGTSQDVFEFFVCFLKVVRFFKLYPEEHPFIGQALRDLRERWRDVREQGDALGFEANTGSITLEGSELFHAPRALEPLKKLLDDKSIEHIAIDRLTEFAEIRALAELLAKTRDEVIERDRIKPVHLLNFQGIDIVRHGTANRAGSPERKAAPRDPDPLADLSRILMSALPEATPRTGGFGAGDLAALARFFVEPQGGAPAPSGLSLPDDPAAVAQALLMAVNRLLLGQDDPSNDDLQAAFAFCLERLVQRELDTSPSGLGGSYEHLETLVANALRPFDEGFVHKVIPDTDDGGGVDGLFRRFSTQLKIRLLKQELARQDTDDERFRQALERFTATDAERQDLIASLQHAVTEDAEFRGDYERAAALLGERPQTTREQPIILALEPLPDECRTLRQAFQSDDVILHIAMTSEEFYETLERSRPDLLIIEPKLRDVHGLQIIAQLRRDQAAEPIPICVFTEEASYQYEFEVVTYPDLKFVTKSEGTERLSQVVMNMLADGKGPSRETVVDEDRFRPDPAVANRHFFVPRFEILTYHHPDPAGLDTYFDVVPIDETKTGIVIADGFRLNDGDEPAMRELRRAIHRALLMTDSPREVLRRLNDAVHECFDSPPLVPVQAVILDAKTGTATCCWSGGPRPIRLGPTGDAEELAIPSGIVLGFSQTHVFDASLKERVFPMQPGHSLFLHCHGMAAAVGGGDEQRAFRELRRDAALSFHEAKTASKALVIARNRVQSMIEAERAHEGDKAGIWVRALERSDEAQPSPLAPRPLAERRSR